MDKSQKSLQSSFRIPSDALKFFKRKPLGVSSASSASSANVVSHASSVIKSAKSSLSKLGMSRPASSAYCLGFSDGASAQSRSCSVSADRMMSSFSAEGDSLMRSYNRSSASVARIKKSKPYADLRKKYLREVDENQIHKYSRTATRYLFNIPSIDGLKEWRDFIQRLIESRKYERNQSNRLFEE